jgi:hypothetical protein
MPKRNPTKGVPAPLNSRERGFENAKSAAFSQHDQEVAAREEKTARLRAARETRKNKLQQAEAGALASTETNKANTARLQTIRKSLEEKASARLTSKVER